MRRRLRLDNVIEHAGLPWLPTEPEKVGAFEELGIVELRGARPGRMPRHHEQPALRLGRVPGRREPRPGSRIGTLISRALPAALDSLPAKGSMDRERPPEGVGPACENTPGPAPVAGPRLGGSLPSTSVLPSAAQAAGWQRPQLQAPARDSRIRRLRIFTGAMRASTPNVSCTLQYGTRRGLLIGSVPPRAEPSARCRCVASAPALPACAPASSARRCASSRPASLRTPSGPGHPP